MCVQVYMHAQVWICGGRRTSLAAIPQEAPIWFLRQGSSLSWSSPAGLGWLSSKPQNSCLHLLSSEMHVHNVMPSSFTWFLGIHTRILIFAQKSIYCVSHYPNLKFLLRKSGSLNLLILAGSGFCVCVLGAGGV